MNNTSDNKLVGRVQENCPCNSEFVGRMGSRLSTPIAIFWLSLPLIFLLFSATESTMAQDFDQSHHLYDSALKKYVENGMVSYGRFKTDTKALDRYLYDVAAVSENKFRSWNEAQQLAFLFNLYNAATLRLILDHYPVKSIKDIGSFLKGPWDRPVVRLLGKTITLNALEQDILRKQYSEPRLHMALVCAAKGCPPLRSEAYIAKQLNEQLDDQARQFLRNPVKFRIDRRNGVVYLSPIFKWYGSDFHNKYSPSSGFIGLGETQRTVMNFCARYLPDGDRKYLEAGGYSVKFLDYDWSLNERKEAP